MLNRTHKRIALLALGLFILTVAAFPADTPSVGYTERTWQMQDGLPEQVVQAFAQTVDRYLWIGTTGGLLRFDGERFVTFDRENTPAFSENNVFCLLVSRDDSLWIGMEGGGLLRYKNGAFHSFSSSDGLTNNFVRVVYQDTTGKIWVGTDNGLFQIVGERVQRIDNTDSFPAIAVHAIHEDSHGGLWAGGSRLVRLNDGSPIEFHLRGDASQNRVKSIIETRHGTVWVGTVSGLQKMTPTGQLAFTRVPEITGTVRFLRETSDGTLWIGTIGHGLHTYRDNRFAEITAPNALPSNTVLNLFEDIEKNLWIGTQGGMVRLSKTPVRTVTLPDAADSDAETVYQDHNGDLWVAAVNLFRYHNGKATPYQFPGLSGVRIRNVFRERDGALWIGTEGRGAYRQVGSRLVQYSTKEGLTNNFVRAFLQGRDGSVWIATDEGVNRWRPEGITTYQMRDGLCYFSTRSMLEDRNGDIWIGTDHGISRLHDGTFVSDGATEALKNEKVWAIHEDSDGGLWFGTRTAGLYRWRSGKLTHYTASEGLASNGIYELLEDRKNNLWMSGPNGISAINRRELDAIADGPSHRAALTLYGVSDGLETIQMCGGEKPAGVLTTQGEVWFPSSKGPVRVSVDQPKPSNPAPVVIDQVVADGRQSLASDKIVLDPDNAKLEVHFGVVLLQSQERVRFRYMMEGFDKGWSDASLAREAYYTNLPPGKYQFRVATFAMNNPEQVAQAAIEIVQKPHFYRTPWFIGGCLLLLGSLAWGAYQFRLGQLRARFQAVLDERNRLAREMHDTLIQGCVSVSALLEAHSSLGHAENTNSDPKNDLLDCARTHLRSAIDEAREAVWDLRQNSAVTDVSPLLERMAERVSHEFGVPIECRISGKPFALDESTVHEVLMVAREALYNSIRHGHPRKVDLGVSFDENSFSVDVRDDGSGFDPAMLSSATGHYGLIGMKERVERIGGKFVLRSQTGKGTELMIQVPRKAIVAQEQATGMAL
ncbi:MAG TPA: two-component regulator propeller domain-containing protein [Terriglobales bacterium]|nr:two-component regulator propeller domain-containing protein [Terriglobales bacterium]